MNYIIHIIEWQKKEQRPIDFILFIGTGYSFQMIDAHCDPLCSVGAYFIQVINGLYIVQN